MNALLVRFAIWLLRLSGESPAADRMVLLSSIEDIRDAELRLARVRARLERLDAEGDNIARERSRVEGTTDG
jgi:hypothetical protein